MKERDTMKSEEMPGSEAGREGLAPVRRFTLIETLFRSS